MSKLYLNEIDGMHFLIPVYQRGYRWTAENVETLLNDLAECPGNMEYCLQPIVLQRCGDPDGNRFRVVDGQQRLTTIRIIAETLGLDLNWDISHETEWQSRINPHFKDLVRTKAGEMLGDANTAAMIRDYFQGNRKAFFLTYEIPDDADAHDAFLRLNDGKTPLTSSELIKACYMANSGALNEQQKMEISKEWELMENALADDTMWLMLNNRAIEDTPTRVDFLFALAIWQMDGTFDLKTLMVDFRETYNWIGDHKCDLEKLWGNVLECFWWMQSCRKNAAVCNYLGWIREFSDRKACGIYGQWLRCRDMEKFEKSLVAIIQSAVENIDFDEICYGDNRLVTLLVLLNVLECNRNGEYFRFDRYKSENYDIEHISPQTPRDFKKAEERREWFELRKTELPDTEIDNMTDQFPGITDGSIFENNDDFIKLAAYLVDQEQPELDEDAKNHMGNLVLLNRGINRSYHNDFFHWKRRRIADELDDNYILPCTAKAFAKFYTGSPTSVLSWQLTDCGDLHEKMKKMFDDFMATDAETIDGEIDHQFTPRENREVCRNAAAEVNETHQFEDNWSVSFTNFIARYDSIIIPKIQRSYVQGRLDDNGRKCMKNFASALVHDDGNDLCLDFIYGIEGAGNSFMPLDGQQRLTTLVLLHWLRGARVACEFRYESRRAISMFLSRLLADTPPKLRSTTSCTDYVRSRSWFFTAWEEDQGVAGMLRMLDSLYEKLGAEEHVRDLDTVKFFINYLDVSSDWYDDVFQKMNSTGKPLTKFECVKAVIAKYDSSLAEGINDRWAENLWTDQTQIEKLDSKMLFLIDIALKCAGYKGKTNDTFDLNLWLGKGDNCGYFSKYAKIFFAAVADPECNLRNNPGMTPSWSDTSAVEYLDGNVDFGGREFYRSMLVFYALSVIEDDQAFIRVVWNIAENARIHDKDGFVSGVKLVDELAGHRTEDAGWLYRFLGRDGNDIESKFASCQIQEERLKARMITTGHSDEIAEIEKDRILRGRISIFLTDKENNPVSIEDAITRYHRFLDVSGNAGLMGRAMLCFGDYSMWTSGNNWRFIVDGKGLDDFLHFIWNEDKYGNYKRFADVFRMLMDTEGSLDVICERFLADRGGGWRYYFVKYSGVFLAGTGYFCWHNDDEFLIREIIGETMHSYHFNPYLLAAGYDGWNRGNAFTDFNYKAKNMEVEMARDANGQLVLKTHGPTPHTIEIGEPDGGMDVVDRLARIIA
ncbi:MAG: DUF262 domain-containing protein, partial [Victivallaceae bacterium]|nr:DUF262 domain-containing protein [Victivallaceae bacterium]